MFDSDRETKLIAPQAGSFYMRNPESIFDFETRDEGKGMPRDIVSSMHESNTSSLAVNTPMLA